ncbi:hypothetical protein KUH03_38375 [Sphingobacterium sp. E70]|uniref:hypothetical protein n=1 Tax=Sphingobacterium sp. E70 TaxID=2853439 RepID=UPI00211C02A6|nr:hypothetical protein [Sphingobacterium sp. E70]ULT24719.1 hypothetical protein KUH03_38375 [Sphingobacterium sp. E70]
MKIPERYKINTTSFSYYWTKGIGVKLLDKLPNKPNLADADQYIPLLYQYDEACDRLVEHLHLKIGFTKGQQLIRDYLQGKAIESIYDKLISDFMNTLTIEPQWLDWQKVQQGIALSQRSGLTGLIVLRDYCLMGGYESSAINKPLIFTGALKKVPSNA